MRSISILTPIYNSEKTLEVFFRALEEQYIPLGVKEVEFLMCNDGSTDTSAKIISKHLNLLGEKFKVKILSNKNNIGWRQSLSNLYEHSTGEIVVFIDSDAIPVGNDWLNNLVEKILNKSFTIVQGTFWTQLEKDTFWSKQHENWRKSIYLSRFKNKDGTLNCINTRNLAIERSVIESVKNRVGYFLDPKATLAGADSKLGFEIRKLGYVIYLNELAQIKHADPSAFLKIIKQKIKHGYADGIIGIRYKNNFSYSVYFPYVYEKVSPFFSIPITVCFWFANVVGYLQYRNVNHF